MKFVKYIGVTVLVALCLALAINWSFWAVLFLAVTAYGVNTLRADHPLLAKWLGVAVVIVLVSGWTWSNFKGNFPLSYATLPYGKNQADNQIAKLMDPGLSKAKTVLALELRKKEDELATKIPALMQAGKYGEVKTNAQELIDLRKEIDKLLTQMTPPAAPKPTPVKAKSGSATPTSPGKSLTKELQPGQIYDVDDLRQGQSWRYTAFDGSFYHRVDKGDNSACWKVVDNNLPWTADYTGKLQVKAGNTAVKLTVNVL